ncbi:MAG: metal-dependent hydrolase [Pelosinus sp.]|nr:metal-dependent hydrolase [Pelosinus sp.]
MDTLTHAVLGLAVAGLSGQPISLHDPIYIASFLGAQAPDFDIIAQLNGRFAYLRQHRAFSHSLPGILMWSLLISLGMFCFMPTVTFLSAFFWAFAGSVSHIIIDYFNTHGVALLWPLRKTRQSTQLLNVFDPFLLCLISLLYSLDLSIQQTSLATFSIIGLYIMLRAVWRNRAKASLIRYFNHCQIKRLLIMPSLQSILLWDFILETPEHYLVGKMNLLYTLPQIAIHLPKNGFSDIVHFATKTPLGNYFSTSSPFIYFEESKEKDATKIKMYDLRYLLKEEFVHCATVLFDDKNKPYDSYMLSEGKKISVPF